MPIYPTHPCQKSHLSRSDNQNNVLVQLIGPGLPIPILISGLNLADKSCSIKKFMVSPKLGPSKSGAFFQILNVQSIRKFGGLMSTRVQHDSLGVQYRPISVVYF
jgi:hypothetical protein